MTELATPAPARSLFGEYFAVGAILAATIAVLVGITSAEPSIDPEPKALLAPVFAMVLLTALVWLAMAVVRNASVVRGLASVRYYEAYKEDLPPDWIERPARAFNNLMQVPTLFYVACSLMIALRHIDRVEVSLAWCFVLLRTVHAGVYIGWNRVSIRFATYAAGCIVLGVMWMRLAAAVL